MYVDANHDENNNVDYLSSVSDACLHIVKHLYELTF